jgi:ABC-type branched-subunit amino acid transport system substrate-binding protein
MASPAMALDDAEIRGKQIYFEGTSPRGTEITAVVGDEAALLPGSAMPCSSCHGGDGLGRPEGGLIPLDIRWSELVKTYGHVHHNGRRHPPYDDASFARSMVGGVDPANNQLDRAMPLYQMSSEDMADLIAYMKVLENDLDPGVSNDRVQVATLLPLSGPAGATGEAMARVMQGHFEDINKQGGVFGRRIDLLAVPFGQSAEASLENLQQALRVEGAFAVVGAYTIGLDEALLDVLRTDNVPLVGPFTLDPGDAFLDSGAFYIYSGFDEQARALADQAVLQGADAGKIAVASPEDARFNGPVRAVREQVRTKTGGGAPDEQRYASGEFDATEFAERVAGCEALIFLGPQSDVEPLLAALDSKGLSPRVYLLSSLLAQPLFDAPATFDRRIFIAYPTLSSDMTPKGREEYQSLAKTYSLPSEHVQAQLAAFAAAKLLVEGLRRAGRDLSRVKLIEGIEELFAFQTGVTPPLSYGPNRRIGARGAHIVAVDLANKRYAPIGDGWYELR